MSKRLEAFAVDVTMTVYLQDPVKQVGKRRLRSLIQDAVCSWGGSLDPEDILFDTVARVAIHKLEQRGS